MFFVACNKNILFFSEEVSRIYKEKDEIKKIFVFLYELEDLFILKMQL